MRIEKRRYWPLRVLGQELFADLEGTEVFQGKRTPQVDSVTFVLAFLLLPFSLLAWLVEGAFNPRGP